MPTGRSREAAVPLGGRGGGAGGKNIFLMIQLKREKSRGQDAELGRRGLGYRRLRMEGPVCAHPVPAVPTYPAPDTVR